MKNLKPRIIVLVFGVLASFLSVGLIMMKGNPENRVSLDSISEIGEGLLSSLGKTKNILLPIGDDEEMEIGNRIHERVVKSRFARKLGEASLEKYINDVGNKVVPNVKRQGIKYQFHLVDGYYPAAFSVAGGHIYVTTGLISTLKSEAELAGVLAHEVTHVDAKHCIGSIQLSARNQDLSGTGPQTLIDVGYTLFLKTGYSEDQESEADLGGVYLLYRAGYHPMAIIHAFERINKDELLRSGQDKSATMVGDTLNAVGGMVLRYFKTHPPTKDRIDKIKQYISDNKLLNGGQRFYIGQRNYDEKISSVQRGYREELRKDYGIQESNNGSQPLKTPVALSESPIESEGSRDDVSTEHGKISSGKVIEAALSNNGASVTQNDQITVPEKIGKYGVDVGAAGPNPFGTAPTQDPNKPEDPDSYHAEIRRQDRTHAYQRHVRGLISNNKLAEARQLIENLYDDTEREVDSGIYTYTADDLVKILYLEGNLRQAIIRRRQTLQFFNEDSKVNRIIELWYLQDEYRKKVGDEQYFKDIEASATNSPLNMEKILNRVADMTKYKRGLEKEMKEHHYLASIYFAKLHLDKAEDEYKKELKVLHNFRNLWGLFQPSDVQFATRFLMQVLILQGKYDEAIEMAGRLDKAWKKNNPGDYKRTIKNLEYAKSNQLRPNELGYAYGNGTLTHKDMGFYIRDKSYNRLDVPGFDYRIDEVRFKDVGI